MTSTRLSLPRAPDAHRKIGRGRGAVVATDAGDRGALRSAVLAYVAAARRFGLSAPEAARLVEEEMKMKIGWTRL